MAMVIMLMVYGLISVLNKLELVKVLVIVILRALY